MKIKTTLFVAFCTLSLCVSTAKAVTVETSPSFTTTTDLPGIVEKIELRGELMYSVGPNAINAGASKDAIYIEFKQNGQQIYGTTVNTSVQQMVIIPISNATNNGYSVMLSNANGCAEGDVRH